MTGKVKWFNEQKGFGFIERSEKPDAFLHYKNINMKGFKTLEEGQEVEFDEEVTDKGILAKNVRII